MHCDSGGAFPVRVTLILNRVKGNYKLRNQSILLLSLLLPFSVKSETLANVSASIQSSEGEVSYISFSAPKSTLDDKSAGVNGFTFREVDDFRYLFFYKDEKANLDGSLIAGVEPKCTLLKSTGSVMHWLCVQIEFLSTYEPKSSEFAEVQTETNP